MNKTLLVKLFYKGKVFFVALSEGSDNKNFLIGKKLKIGTGNKILWQLFENDFPAIFDLIVKVKDSYYLNLHKSMSLDIQSDGKQLGLEELKSKGLLKDKQLLLKENCSGAIHIGENTKVTFTYINPKDTALTESEKKLLASIVQVPKLSAQDKFSRIAVTSVVFIIIIMAVVWSQTYVPVKEQSIFEDVVAIDYEDIVTDMTMRATEEPEEAEPTDAEKDAEAAKKAKEEAEKKAEEAEQAVEKQQKRNEQIAAREKIKNARKAKRAEQKADGGSRRESARKSRSKAPVIVGSSRRGFKSTKRSNVFNIEGDTSSSFESLAKGLKQDRSNKANSSAIGKGGISASEIGDSKTVDIATGDIDIDALDAAVRAGSGVGNLEVSETETTALEKGTVEQIKKKKKNLSDPQKKSALDKWFQTKVPRLNESYNRFKSRNNVRGFKVWFSYES
ncbi:MAG: hypothetical protein B6226_05080 [Candidatus Cloacimonetes bacterium 4572_65]|nr:MAG: hypothetical protein B6226_05080 [Candidatus Cloacimonetes bacterium 4572_65]